ncbi:hypothetical protein [Kitasatospora sp. NPDC056800]|uniref:hypothetical protein n=1 Tax=Kitasatospora sp. NPDC056800 TaxID=3345948 RepID=UPI00367BCD22
MALRDMLTCEKWFGVSSPGGPMNAVTRFSGSRLLSLAGTVVLACGLLLVPASAPARAQVLDQECTGTFTTQYTPALTEQPQTVSSATQSSYTNCPLRADSGSSAVTVSVPGDTCVGLLRTIPPFDETITWSNGLTSTVHWASAEISGSAIVFTGSVTAGLYAGDTAGKTQLTTGTTGTNPALCPIGEGTVTGDSGTVILTLNGLL